MPDQPSIPSRLRFFDDLRRIREARGLSLEALHEETKIPLGVLEDFEKTGLFENKMFNRVYLRSLVRSYAVNADISSKVVLESLDEALLDAYQGRLAVDYLSEKTVEEEVTPAQAETSELDATPEEEGQVAVAKPVPPKAPETEPVVDATDLPRSATEEPAKPTPPLLSTAEPTWRSSPRERRGRSMDIRWRSSNVQWMFIVGAVLIFAGSIWAVLAFLDRPDDTQRQGAAVDTTNVDTVAVAPARVSIVVGDTLDVVVIAVEQVERIHIKRDEDARRPYWIEEGVAKAYPSLEQIILQDKLDRIRLLVEGFEYPTDILDERDRLVITRNVAQAFLDTLTVDPVSLPSPPETVPMIPVRSQ